MPGDSRNHSPERTDNPSTSNRSDSAATSHGNTFEERKRHFQPFALYPGNYHLKGEGTSTQQEWGASKLEQFWKQGDRHAMAKNADKRHEEIRELLKTIRNMSLHAYKSTMDA